VSLGEETFALHLRAAGIEDDVTDNEFLRKFGARIKRSLYCWEWTGGRTGNGYGHAESTARTLARTSLRTSQPMVLWLRGCV